MRYESFSPSDSLINLVKEYWIFENDDQSIHEQKIIPDGYSEIIIHYGDAYQINLSGKWEQQSPMLFSNQISKYFFLKNTGASAMLGIKLHPAAFYQLFQIDVSQYTDRVVDLKEIVGDTTGLDKIMAEGIPMEDRVKFAEKWLEDQLSSYQPQKKIERVISKVLENHGMIDVEQMADDVQLSSRQLERLFKKVVGLTPKFYSRIVRFNYIFEVIKEQKDSWIRTALQSGFFDQSHFIKNFKEFTGEEPSNYGFDDVNLANFFLNK